MLRLMDIDKIQFHSLVLIVRGNSIFPIHHQKSAKRCTKLSDISRKFPARHANMKVMRLLLYSVQLKHQRKQVDHSNCQITLR